MFGELLHGGQKVVIWSREFSEQPDQIAHRAMLGSGRRDAANGLATPFDQEGLPTIANPVEEVGKGSNGLGRGNM